MTGEGAPRGALAGRPILVTGAGGGIGSAVAEACGREGARLFLVDRDPAVEQVADSLAAGFEVADLAMGGAAERAVVAAAARLGGLEGMVQAAGVQIPRRPLAELTDADWERLVAVNLTAVMAGCRAAARTMARGSIVNVGSVSARAGMAGIVAYSATKAAVHQLTRGLALELAPRVRVNAVAPGFVRTGITEPLLADDEERRAIEQRVPLGHVAEPAEIAATVVFLLSEAAGYVTGEVLTVDGGLLSH